MKSYEGQLVLETELRKKRNKVNSLVSEKTSIKYFRISYDARKLCYKINKNLKEWHKEISFKNLINLFAYVDEEDKNICDYPYGFQIVTKDRKYVLFCKEEGIHYHWIRMLAYVILKKDIGSYEQYQKIFPNTENSTTVSASIRFNPLNSVKPLILKSTIHLNVNEGESIITLSKIKNINRSNNNSLISESGCPNKKRIMQKNSLINFSSLKLESDTDINNCNSNKSLGITGTAIIHKQDLLKKIEEIEIDNLLETNTKKEYSNHNNKIDFNDIEDLMNLMDSSFNTQELIKINKFNNDQENNNNTPVIPDHNKIYRYPKKGVLNRAFHINNHENTLPKNKNLLFDEFHIKNDLSGEKINIENLHCGIDDTSSFIDRGESVLVGNIPINSLNKIGFNTKSNPIKLPSSNSPSKSKRIIEHYDNLLGFSKSLIKSGDKVLSVDRNILGCNEDNSWILNLKIKEK